MEKEKTTPKEISQQKLAYLEFQADMGVTKHLGGSNATKELVELCHIDKDKFVLDVGCGIGTSACLLAKRYGCRAVGVDISEKMIEWSRKRMKEEGVEDRVEFKVADAQKLPFEDLTFDLVICESVLAFLKNKRKALLEMVRVTKPKGYIGLNETTWLTTPLPEELIKYFASIAEEVELELLTPERWRELLESVGLEDIVVRTYKITALRDFIDRFRLIGLWRVLRSWFRLIIHPSYWGVLKFLRMPKDLYEYYGYGIYVGRK